MIGSSKELKEVIVSGYYRVYKNISRTSILKNLVFGEKFKCFLSLRLSIYFNYKYFLFYYISKIILRRYKYKFTICVPNKTSIFKGFYLVHLGAIFISKNAKTSDNCDISQGVTIGKLSNSLKRGAPVIENSVYIGSVEKIIVNVKIGSYSAIGTNAVVTSDVLENKSVAYIFARVVSNKFAFGYINNILELDKSR